MMRIVAVALTFAIAGCGSSSKRCSDWAVSSAFDDNEYVSIRSGATLWNDAAGHELISVVRGDRDTCAIVRGKPTDGAIGQAVRTNITLDAEPSWLAAVSAHEFGHELGLRHVEGPAVMAAIGDGVAKLRPADLEECQRAGVCP